MNKFVSLVCVACAILLGSCVSSVKVMKPEGESVTVTFKNDRQKRAEILAVSDSMIYLISSSHLYAAPLRNVRKIYVPDFQAAPGSKALAAIGPLLLETTVMLVAFDVDQPVWGVVSLAAMIGTTALFTLGGPKVNFSPPLAQKDLDKLRLFCRYPQGLTEEQWQELLRHHGQEKFVTKIE